MFAIVETVVIHLSKPLTIAHSCWSYVGELRISGGQPVSIGDGCDAKGTVLHEVMHALGFFHTSSRYDRDSYVVVMPENIMEGKYIEDKNLEFENPGHESSNYINVLLCKHFIIG